MSDIVRERRGTATAGANAARERVRPSPLRGVARMLTAVLALVVGSVVALAIGFVAFVDDISRARPPADPRAQGIVVLTGGSERIDSALKLMAEGRAERLLISGVNPSVGPAALAGVLSENLDAVMECCVDLGHTAIDTNTNATEARAWVAEQGYDSLIVVTSAYHMPRSLAELRAAMPDVALTPYPIASPQMSADVWRDPTTLALLLREYGKFLVASARAFVGVAAASP